MRRLMMLSAICLAVSAAPALAQKEAPPAPGTPTDFVLPTPVRVTLPNGMKVTMVQYGAIPKVQVTLSVAAGNVEETASQVWLADVVTSLMTEGTTKRSGADIAKTAATMGGAISAGAGPVRATVGGEALSEFAADMVRLVAEVAMTPSFPAGELDRVKADKQRQLALQKSTPQGMAAEKLAQVMYGDHPYGRYFPTEAALGGYTLDQVRAFHDAKFSAARARLYVVGKFDAAAVERAVRDAFGGWKAGTAGEPPRAKPTSTRAVYLVDKPGAVQSRLIVGVPVIDPSHPDWIPLSVANTLLGGYFSSRITANIREAKGYTYSPGSGMTAHPGDAYWAQYADVTTAVTGASLKEIFYEIDRLQAEAPPEAELDAVKNYQAGTFVFQNSQRGGISGQLQFLDQYGLPDSYLTGYVGKVRAITPAQVQQMTTKYIDDTKATIVVVGDRKEIEAQVKPYGPVK
jgi:predicted Zn-dependent peptidase